MFGSSENSKQDRGLCAASENRSVLLIPGLFKAARSHSLWAGLAFPTHWKKSNEMLRDAMKVDSRFKRPGLGVGGGEGGHGGHRAASKDNAVPSLTVVLLQALCSLSLPQAYHNPILLGREEEG